MASLEKKTQLDQLPREIQLKVLNHLEPCHIKTLQLVSQSLRKLCLDDVLWKRICFGKSSWYQCLKSHRKSTFGPAENANRAGDELVQSCNKSRSSSHSSVRQREQQDEANWDPAFPGEQVSWYDEYIQRHASTSVNWLECPRMRGRSHEAVIEARGMALYSPYDGNDGRGTMLAVSPLDDGSVCLWDVKGTRGRQGGIVSRSKPDILFVDGPGSQNSQRSKRIDTGVTECVSVSNNGHRAFFAVQSHLIEVDLHRLEVVRRESFEWSITSLSDVHDGVPLTVGTSLAIYLHDFRTRATGRHDVVERLDEPALNNDVVRALFDPKPLPPYAPLSQPTPISILHLPQPGSHDLVSNDIYVSGRFTNILHYDRRKFPTVAGSIWSGARIKSLAALPYPFSSVESEIRRQAGLSPERIAQSRNEGQGRTLIAGGAYNSKGSLEIYGLGSASATDDEPTLQTSAMQNRYTAAPSTILSVTNHGTKIAFSDGSGFLKWFERDGCTECRRIKIGPPTSDDMARKILSTESTRGGNRQNDDNILLWTGEKLGMVSFSTSPHFDSKTFEVQDPKLNVEVEKKRHEYSLRMQRALSQQTNELNFIGSLAGRTI
ncbi:hypothetical protein QQS21_012196 [Conoideocrella luteorostrata]|uniref:F-box domain-containing protein n=1 Tax=Conoideocrella luteorostrata TaxID=1105319 RepID=A0AAJ0FSX8_9HYPO|nr:hypothetical protein QQS21_012196 [Conoideocrella luteorostrata]